MKIPFQVSRFIENSQYFSNIYINQLVRKIKNLQENAQNNSQFVSELIRNPSYFRVRPAQIPYEMETFLNLAQEIQPKTLLEIGSANGGTLLGFAQICAENALIISIDLPKEQGGCQVWRDRLYPRFARNTQNIVFTRGDSSTKDCEKKIRNLLGNKKLDLVFIDGDHSFEGVNKDFKLYRKLMSPRGIVAFHDIMPGPKQLVGGVPEFWSQIKNNYNFKEIISDNNQAGYGIGVLFLEQ